MTCTIGSHQDEALLLRMCGSPCARCKNVFHQVNLTCFRGYYFYLQITVRGRFVVVMFNGSLAIDELEFFKILFKLYMNRRMHHCLSIFRLFLSVCLIVLSSHY